jgi:hypothetical protein
MIGIFMTDLDVGPRLDVKNGWAIMFVVSFISI